MYHSTIGIAPFFLYPDNERPWMCPVCALANWWTLCTHSNVKCGGYIFRKRIGKDDISARALDCMVGTTCLACWLYLRNGYSPSRSIKFLIREYCSCCCLYTELVMCSSIGDGSLVGAWWEDSIPCGGMQCTAGVACWDMFFGFYYLFL